MDQSKPLLIVGLRDEAINKTFAKDFHILVPGQNFAHLKFKSAFSATRPRDVEFAWWKAVERSTEDGKVHWLF